MASDQTTNALAEAVRHTREQALREAMAMVERMQPTMGVDWSADQGQWRLGHREARMQIHAEIERMIAREAPAPTTQAGYTSDGLEDWTNEDPGTCAKCGVPFELVRPGKSQPTCDCYSDGLEDG